MVARNGQTPLYRADVVIEDVKQPGYYGRTETDAAGEFDFPEVPDARYRLTATAANGLFNTYFFADVLDGHSPDGVEVAAKPTRAGTFIVVPGVYDDMGVIFADLGYVYRTVDVASLAVSPSPLAGMDIVCLNSGVDISWAASEAVKANLRSFVDGGGRLLVSDRAWPFVREIWPAQVTWGSDPETGKGGQDTAGTLTDDDFKRCMAVSEWDLRYDMDGWALPATTSATVFIRGDVATTGGDRAGAPLLLGFASGKGYVVYATFNWRTQYLEGRFPVPAFYYFITNR